MDDDSVSEEETPILKRPKNKAGGSIKLENKPSGIKLKRAELKQQKKNRKLKKLLKQIDLKSKNTLAGIDPDVDGDGGGDKTTKKTNSTKKKNKSMLDLSATDNFSSEHEPTTTAATESENSTAAQSNLQNQQGRSYSVSVAVPGSIIDNAQSPPLKAYLAGQVARAVAIFNVDEVIVYDDTGGNCKPACEFMARILQFLECPQYLRKSLFPLHPDLQFSGVVAPLDIPHHLRKHEVLPYRYDN
jgi:hypothetical protein